MGIKKEPAGAFLRLPPVNIFYVAVNRSQSRLPVDQFIAAVPQPEVVAELVHVFARLVVYICFKMAWPYFEDPEVLLQYKKQFLNGTV